MQGAGRSAYGSAAVGGASANGRGGSAQRPQKGSGKGSGKGPWRIVFWAALLVFALSAAALAYIGYTYWQGQKTYDDIAADAFTVPESSSLADFEVDWDALRAINPDVVGWIYVPGTEINYPIAWREGDDDYYLKHNFNGVSSAEFGAEYGSIMLSGVNEPDFSDEVNIIYGHNMANGSMFAQLAKFHDADAFNSYRLMYLLTPQGNYLLRSFAVVHVPGSSTDIIIPNFESDEDRVAYMQDKIDASIVEPDPAGSAAADIDRAFAMVTCDGANRSYRYITYCEALEFYPAGSAGTAASTGASSAGEGSAFISDESIVTDDDLANVGDAASARTS